MVDIAVYDHFHRGSRMLNKMDLFKPDNERMTRFVQERGKIPAPTGKRRVVGGVVQ